MKTFFNNHNIFMFLMATIFLIILVGCEGELVSVSGNGQGLYKINTQDCTETLITDLSSCGALGGVGLTFQTEDVLYISSWDISQDKPALYSVDIANPEDPDCKLKDVCDYQLTGLAFCPDGTLYGMANAPESQLFIVNPNDCTLEAVGDGLGVELGNRGLTCNQANGELYAFGSSEDKLYIINKSSGLASEVGPLGVDILGGVGIEFDPINPRKLYGSMDQDDDEIFELYEINPDTGNGIYICDLPHASANLGARVVIQKKR